MRCLNRTILLLGFCVLCSCSTPQILERSPSATCPSPDGLLYVTIRYTTKPATVAIVERETGKVIGVADSSSQLNSEGERVPGKVRITYSRDLSTIVVHEYTGDGSPNPRYILFQRPAGSSTAYSASYFAPPTVDRDAPFPFSFISPDIQRVTSSTITLKYHEIGKTRVMRISDLLRTNIPTGSQIWVPLYMGGPQWYRSSALGGNSPASL